MSDAHPRQSKRPPGPPDPPFIPGHMGAPSYRECAAYAALIGICEVAGRPIPTALAFKLGADEERIREWVRKEINRGNLDKIVEAAREPLVGRPLTEAEERSGVVDA